MPRSTLVLFAALALIGSGDAVAQPANERHGPNRGDAQCGEITLGRDGLRFEDHGPCRPYGHPHHGGYDHDHEGDYDQGPYWSADAVLFEHSNFRGAALPLRRDMPNLAEVDFNDRASSIQIRDGGWQGCTEIRYRGRCFSLFESERRLSDNNNDRIRSIRRFR